MYRLLREEQRQAVSCYFITGEKFNFFLTVIEKVMCSHKEDKVDLN